MNEVEEFYLQHYGVKGMKWGVRKRASAAKKRVKREVSSYRRERNQLKVKDPREMTDRELKKTLNRNRLENQLKTEYKKTPGFGRNRVDERVDRRKANRDTYLDRASLSDKQLQSKVDRIRSENQLVFEANRVNRKSIEVGSSFMAGVSTSLVKDVVSGGDFSTGQKITRALISGGVDATRTYFKETESEKKRYDNPYGKG